MQTGLVEVRRLKKTDKRLPLRVDLTQPFLGPDEVRDASNEVEEIAAEQEDDAEQARAEHEDDVEAQGVSIEAQDAEQARAEHDDDDEEVDVIAADMTED
jgi:hypothetical protein